MRFVYQLEGQQLRLLERLALSIRDDIEGRNTSNVFATIHRIRRDATQIGELLTEYLSQPQVAADD